MGSGYGNQGYGQPAGHMPVPPSGYVPPPGPVRPPPQPPPRSRPEVPRGTVVRWVAGGLVFGVVAYLLGVGVLVGRDLWVYGVGTETVATVDRCEEHRRSRGNSYEVCYGSWTLDGTRHSGRVYSHQEDPRDGNSDEVAVRATKRSAATTDTPEAAREALLFGLGVIPICGVMALVYILRRRGRYRTRGYVSRRRV